MKNLFIKIYREHVTADCIVFSTLLEDFNSPTLERCTNLACFLFPSSVESSNIFRYVLYSLLKSIYNMYLNVDRFSSHVCLEHRFVSSQGDTFYLELNANI